MLQEMLYHGEALVDLVLKVLKKAHHLQLEKLQKQQLKKQWNMV